MDITIISRLSIVYGDLASVACVDVGGKVVGNVRCDCLIVRKGGVVQGDVVANTVVIDGNVQGLVRTKHAKLKKNAIINGSIEYDDIAADTGASITGHLNSAKEGCRDISTQQKEISIIKEEVMVGAIVDE